MTFEHGRAFQYSIADVIKCVHSKRRWRSRGRGLGEAPGALPNGIAELRHPRRRTQGLCGRLRGGGDDSESGGRKGHVCLPSYLPT